MRPTKATGLEEKRSHVRRSLLKTLADLDRQLAANRQNSGTRLKVEALGARFKTPKTGREG